MKKAFYKILLGINVLFAFSLALSYLSVHINPDIIAFPALFGLAYPYLLLINILFCLIWVINLKWEVLISLLVILAGYTHFSNYLKVQKPEGDKTGTFQVQSYNVRLFNYYEGPGNSNSEKKILELLRNQRADVICLQEIFLSGDPLLKQQEIKAALGKGYNSHFKIIRTGRNRSYGIVTLSRYPIVSRNDIVHEKSSSLSIYTDIIADGDTIRIFNNHLQSFRLHRRERTFITELFGGIDERDTFNEIVNLSSSLRAGFIKRSSQAQALREIIGKSPYPVIVAGDFNDTPVSYSYRKIRKGLNDAFLSAGYGAGFTYKGNYPPNRIDYILFDNFFECRHFNIEKVKYSDHYPITAFFRKKK